MMKKSFQIIIFLTIITAVTSIGATIAFSESTLDEKIEYYFAKKDFSKIIEIGSPALPKLIDRLNDKDRWVRYYAAWTLGEIGDKKAKEALLKLIENDTESKVMLGGTEALKKIGYAPNTIKEELVYYMAGKQTESLVEMGAVAVVPLIKVLNEGINIEERAFAAKVLGDLRDERAVEPLIAASNCLDCVDSKYYNVFDHYPVTVPAIESLGIIGDKRAVNHLIQFISPKKKCNATVWRACAVALGFLGGKQAVEPLIQLLGETRYSDSAAHDALIKLGSSSVEPLINVLENQNDEKRKLATSALGNIGDKRAVLPISKLLKDKQVDVRLNATKALAKLKDKRAIEPLITTLKDKDSEVRSEAAKALDDIGWKP